MKWYAHITCSSLLAIALNPAWAPTAAVGAVLPDAVEKVARVPHRSMHELAAWMSLLPLLATGYAGIALGAVHHILLDALTVYGVTIIGRRVRGPFNTNRILDNIAVILLHFALLYAML